MLTVRWCAYQICLVYVLPLMKGADMNDRMDFSDLLNDTVADAGLVALCTPKPFRRETLADVQMCDLDALAPLGQLTIVDSCSDLFPLWDATELALDGSSLDCRSRGV